MQTRTLLAAGVAVVALIASGCGALPTTDDAAAEPTSPLADFLGLDSNGPGADQFQEQERKANELVVSCMKAQGFEFIPESDSVSIPDAFSDDDLPYDSREWAEKYGYGMSTTFADQISGGPGSDEFQDPNQEYIDQLGEAEVEAYYKALYGDEPDFDPTEELSEQDLNLEPSGCQGEAFTEVFEGGGYGQVYQEFGDELESMYERMESDPRVVEANGEWSTCIREAGYEFTKPEDAFNAVQAKMEPLWGDQSTHPFDSMTEEEIANLTEAESQELFAAPEIDEQALAEVQKYEIAVAVADWECSKDMRDLQMEVIAEYEQDFVDSNRDRLEELKSESS